MELLDVPRESYVKILEKDVKMPMGVYPSVKENDIIFFDHIDGMYSFCKDLNGNIIHLSFATEVELSTEKIFLEQ
jgi:hypothetical protein